MDQLIMDSHKKQLIMDSHKKCCGHKLWWVSSLLVYCRLRSFLWRCAVGSYQLWVQSILDTGNWGSIDVAVARYQDTVGR